MRSLEKMTNKHFYGYSLVFIVILGSLCTVISAEETDLPLTKNEDGHNTTADSHGNSTGNHSNKHEVHRYQVAKFDWNYVQAPYIICAWVLLASLAKLGFHFNDKLSSIFPESCLLIILGIILGIILYFTNVRGYEMNAQVFFLFLLPPIILDAGYFMPLRPFFDNIGTILLFAIVATLFNTALIGLSLWGFSLAGGSGIGLIRLEIGILPCFVLSSLLSAVDPVAVLAVFEEVHVNEMLHIVVFGESLLNDGVTVVLYHMFETFTHIGMDNLIAVDIIAGIGSFFVIALGGTIIGILIGFLTAFISKYTDHVRVIEPLLVFVMGYLAFLSAELFHFSGILSCTFCGITMRKYVEKNISQKSHTTIKYFLKMLASACETIIFMLLGISTVMDNHMWDTAFVLLTLAFCLIFRACGVLIFSFFANKLRLDKITKVDQFIMAYGGLRGAIAYSLVILLNEDLFPLKKLFITSTVVVVFFTVFIQGATIKPLVNALKVKRAVKRKPTLNEQINNKLLDHFMAGIEDVTGYHGHHELREKFQHIDNKYLKPWFVRNKKIRARGLSIVNVYEKLTEKEAMDFAARRGSISQFTSQMSNTESLAAYFARRNSAQQSIASVLEPLLQSYRSGEDSVSNFPMPTSDSGTCLDMNAIEDRNSRKMKDDSKAHHIFEDHVIKVRKRYRHTRHMLNESEHHQVFHHKARFHLRHLLSKNRHLHKNLNKNHINNEDNHVHVNGLHTTETANGKPRKNVSFAENPVNPIEDEKGSVEVEISEKGEDSEYEDDDSDYAEDKGIIFTAAHKTTSGISSPTEDSDSLREPIEPSAVEMQLPWKRDTGRQPISSAAKLSMPDEVEPPKGEAPSWVNNLEYTHPAVHQGDTENVLQVGDMIALEIPHENLPVSVEEARLVGSNNSGYNTPSPEVNICPFQCNDNHERTQGLSNGLGNYNNDTSAIDNSHDSLPLPWRSGPCVPTTHATRDQNGGGAVTHELPPPWKCAPTDTNNHTVSDVIPPPWKQPQSTGQLPLPWRQNSRTSEILSDPGRHGERRDSLENHPSDPIPIIPPPWRQQQSEPITSPSVVDLDTYSMRPQPSTHSFRISEAESKHSEHYQMPHVMDLPSNIVSHEDYHDYPQDGGILLDLDASSEDESDFNHRIHKWLLTSEPDVNAPVIDESVQFNIEDDTENLDLTLVAPDNNRKEDHTCIDIDTKL